MPITIQKIYRLSIPVTVKTFVLLAKGQGTRIASVLFDKLYALSYKLLAKALIL